MKVLSLTEPYATLIKEGKKLVETRSWSTSYRGELYIHASMTRIPKEWRENEELMALVHDSILNFGCIVCKCQLIDCIRMTEEYIHSIRKDDPQEYLCGEYSVGRYAWILTNVEPLKNPIQAKGHLGIWNYEF